MKTYTFCLGENLNRSVEIPEDKELNQYYLDGWWYIPIDYGRFICIQKSQVRYIVGQFDINPDEFEQEGA